MDKLDFAILKVTLGISLAICILAFAAEYNQVKTVEAEVAVSNIAIAQQ